MAINSNPTTANNSNAPGTSQMEPQYNLTWNIEEPPKGHAPLSKFTLIHNTTPHGTHLVRQPVPYKYCIYTRDLKKTASSHQRMRN